MEYKEFFSLPVRKRHLIERRELQESKQRHSASMELIRARQEVERLEAELGISKKVRAELSCKECGRKGSPIYNLEETHYLDGDHSNKLHSNIAIVCPRCGGHIVLSPYTPQGIWGLKLRGLSNAAIGRLLGVSRERVRQLSNHYKPEPVKADNIDIDSLIQGAQRIETSQKERGLRKRRTDKRTIRKRIIMKLTKLEEKLRG